MFLIECFFIVVAVGVFIIILMSLRNERKQTDLLKQIRIFTLRIAAKVDPAPWSNESKQKTQVNHGEVILLTVAEKQSGTNRVKWAELLIQQLPEDHDGRNSWLLNYGTGEEAVLKRSKRGLAFNDRYKACETISN